MDTCPVCSEEIRSGQWEECFGFHWLETFCCEYGEMIANGESTACVRAAWEAKQTPAQPLTEEDIPW